MRRRRLSIVAPLAVLALTTAGVTGWQHRSAHRFVPLYSSTVALDSRGELVLVAPDDADLLVPGSRVLLPDDVAARPAAERLAAEQRRWLDGGAVPGAGTPYEPMVRDALLDMRTLTLPNGASLASGYGGWRYVWPRDASFVAVALARSGHRADAEQILAFLARVQPADGVFEARYRPDGTPVLDGRGKEPDGVGWSLWAAWEVSRAAPDPVEQRRVLARLQPLLTRSVAATVQLTGSPGSPGSPVRLPAPGLDYWEVEERTLTLGVVAPLLAGSAAAAKIYAALGDGAQAERLRTRHDQLATAVTAAFGPYYPRHQGRGAADQDAAVVFLLPPFTDPGDAVDPAVERARQAAVVGMRRPAGGLAPGVAWPADGISWTPETALFALAAASANRQEEAREWLDFLLAHRTAAGSLPEKVLRDGTPAAASPLAWTGACVVLAVAALTDPADE